MFKIETGLVSEEQRAALVGFRRKDLQKQLDCRLVQQVSHVASEEASASFDVVVIDRVEQVGVQVTDSIDVVAVHVAPQIQDQVRRILSGQGQFSVFPRGDLQDRQRSDGRNACGRALGQAHPLRGSEGFTHAKAAKHRASIRGPCNGSIVSLDPAERDKVQREPALPVTQLVCCCVWSCRELSTQDQVGTQRFELGPVLHHDGEVHVLGPASHIDSVCMSEHDVAGGSTHEKELQARGNRDGLKRSHYPAKRSEVSLA